MVILSCLSAHAEERTAKTHRTEKDADGNIVVQDGELVLPDVSVGAQLERLKREGFSNEQLQDAARKLSNQPLEEPVMMARSSWIYHTPSISFHRQIEDNYCVHACTQMALEYFGQSVDQNELNNSILLPTDSGGSHITYAAFNVLNKRQKENNYVYREGTQVTLSIMSNHLYTSIATYHAPAILGIHIDSNLDWPYYNNPGQSAHALVLSGSMGDKSVFQVTDPISGFVGGGMSFRNVPQKYGVYPNMIYNGINSKDMGYIF